MPAPSLRQDIQQAPLGMVGSSKFGRYPKISVEQTWNMLISDNCLVPYAGYKDVVTVDATVPGRGIYSSSRGGIILAVYGSQAYIFNTALSATFIGNLNTNSGDVFLSENNNAEIAFTDGAYVYVYNYLTTTFKVSGTDFSLPAGLSSPGYISFQNGRLILANNGTTNWYLSAFNNAISWPSTANSVGALQSKPDKIQAAVPTPGGGNTLYLFGHNVIEQWQDVGTALFPYQRASTFNVDYGTLNASSIAALDNYVVWLAGNEQSGATVMIINNGQSKQISTDGINFKLTNLNNPENCTGFLFRQDGHVIYQFTFLDDNLSYILDLETGMFFNVSDENLNYHIARNVVFFNNDYYFVSLRGGNLYQFGTQYTDADYGSEGIKQLPRLRVTPPFRLPSQRMFIIKSVGFTIENGQPNIETTASHETPGVGINITTENSLDLLTEGGVEIVEEDDTGPTITYVTYSEVVDLSVSRDGGETFGPSWRLDMNRTGNRKSRFIWQRIGQANDATFQFRFSGFGRFVIADEGIIEHYL